LPIHTMRKGETVSLAGFRFFKYPINNVSMSFKTETSELFKGALPSVGALVPKKLDKKTSVMHVIKLNKAYACLSVGLLRLAPRT